VREGVMLLHSPTAPSLSRLIPKRALANLWAGLAACYAVLGACGTRNILFNFKINKI